MRSERMLPYLGNNQCCLLADILQAVFATGLLASKILGNTATALRPQRCPNVGKAMHRPSGAGASTGSVDTAASAAIAASKLGHNRARMLPVRRYAVAMML